MFGIITDNNKFIGWFNTIEAAIESAVEDKLSPHGCLIVERVGSLTISYVSYKSEKEP